MVLIAGRAACHRCFCFRYLFLGAVANATVGIACGRVSHGLCRRCLYPRRFFGAGFGLLPSPLLLFSRSFVVRDFAEPPVFFFAALPPCRLFNGFYSWVRACRAAAAVTAAAASAAAEEAETRARSAVSQSQKAAEMARRSGEEEAEQARRSAREELARAKEEVDMAAEEERARACEEVYIVPSVSMYSGSSVFWLQWFLLRGRHVAWVVRAEADVSGSEA